MREILRGFIMRIYYKNFFWMIIILVLIIFFLKNYHNILKRKQSFITFDLLIIIYIDSFYFKVIKL